MNKKNNDNKIETDWGKGSILALFYALANMVINQTVTNEAWETIWVILSTIAITLIRPFAVHTYKTFLNKHIAPENKLLESEEKE